MRVQQRYDVYGRSSFFHDGAVVQAPPPNTIARPADAPWSGNVDTPAFLTGTEGSADVAIPPIAIDEPTLAAGAEQFRVSCVPCHGDGGYGGGVVAGNLAKKPPSLRTPPVSTLAAGTLFKVITAGFGTMPPYGWQMPTATRWAVVAYVRALTTVAPTPLTLADSTTAAYLRAIDSTHTLRARTTVPPPPRNGSGR
jgi:mono/diheme cytochrome c family protein